MNTMNENLQTPGSTSTQPLLNGKPATDGEELSVVLSDIGKKIREIRKSLGESQKGMALKAGIDRAYFNAIEQGRKNITIGSLIKISTALEVSLAELIPRQHS